MSVKPCRRARGFTVPELMVVLVIAGCLAAMALPSFGELIERARLRTTANDFFSAIDLTRSYAIARGSRVLLVPADTGGSDWQQGWTVFVDRNGNRRRDGGEELIYQQGPVASGIRIQAGFSSGAAPAYIAYNGAGRGCTSSNSMAARWGTVSLYMGRQARHIKINMLGRVRICDPQREPANCTPAGGAADD